MSDDVEITVLLATFTARTGRVETLAAALARYVVLTRNRPGCRNVDLVASAVEPGRLTVIEKWDNAEVQRAHMDADETVTLAESCVELLAEPPRFDLCDAISAYDLE
jgi:quinol monooxygenase YgiN